MRCTIIALCLFVATATANADEATGSGTAGEGAPGRTLLTKPSPRQGHYLALGLHLASGLADDDDRGRRGPSFGEGISLRMGERITPRFDVGIAFAYARVRGDNPWSFGRLTVHGQAYVREHWFAAAGFGFGAAGGDDPEDPEFGRGSYGDVYTVGVGRNIYLSDASKSGGWIVTPVVTAEYSRDSEFANSAVWLGVEISHWFGVSRDQLDLDISEAYK